MLLLELLPRRLLLFVVLVFGMPAAGDILGIPTDPRFASARYPYARIVKGCTAWRQPSRLGPRFSPIDFDGACQKHDMCFHTLGRSWGECNQEFLSDLRLACDRDLKRQRLEAGIPGAPDMQALHLCYDITDLFLVRVQEPSAIRRYELAQKQQFQYLAHVQAAIQKIFIAVLRRPATDDEEAEALARLTAGTPLNEIRRLLVTSRADRKAKLSRHEPASELPAIDEASLSGLISPQAQPQAEGTIP